MAISAQTTRVANSALQSPVHLIDVFETSIGWFGLQYRDATIQRIKFGFSKRGDVINAFGESGRCRDQMAGHGKQWRDTIQAYAAGESVSFIELDIETEWMTPFQKDVIVTCRKIPAGTTMTYGQLAKTVGSPGASRAVGSVMRTNRFPIVVPCHRVVGGNGLGGFSAGDGVETKQVLLELEHAFQSQNRTLPLFE